LPDQRFSVLSGLARSVTAAPWPLLPAGALSYDAIRPWMLASVYDRLSAGQGQFLAELRPAVALFARFGGIDYDMAGRPAGPTACLATMSTWPRAS
jgi:hypothetical protein